MQEGTATEEERAYVEEKLKNANASVNSDAPRIIENPKPARVKGQKREIGKFFKLIFVIAAVFVALGVIFSGVFGGAAANAKKAEVISKAEAEKIAQQDVFDGFNRSQANGMGWSLLTSIDEVKLYDIDHDLHYDAAKPMNSFYVYEIIYNIYGTYVEVEVDTRTGNCIVTDINT